MSDETLGKRKSLTKSQIQAGIGAELLTLCQTMTADGVLSDAEITALRNWLEENRSSDLPAICFLITTVEKIMADGKVTKEERLELYKAIEKESIREQKELQKQHEREERERQRPVESANFMVAGVHVEGR
jgi:hypothetical protein